MSTIGIRANWTCAVCSRKATTHQIVHAIPETRLDVPAGWTRGDDNRTICGAPHDLERVGDVLAGLGRSA